MYLGVGMMDSRLQEAIGAARAGETRNAQQLLTDVLKDDPAQVQAWFLLSHLVESPQKQQAYLGKVLTLDPGHEQARQRLALLRSGQTGGAAQAAPVQPAARVADADLDVVVQSEGDTLPDWMAEDAELVQVDTAVPSQEAAAAQTAAPEDLPDWLQESVSDDFLGSEAAEDGDQRAQTQRTLPVQPAKPQKAQQRSGSQAALRRWNLILMTLGIFTIIVLILLINALMNAF